MTKMKWMWMDSTTEWSSSATTCSCSPQQGGGEQHGVEGVRVQWTNSVTSTIRQFLAACQNSLRVKTAGRYHYNVTEPHLPGESRRHPTGTAWRRLGSAQPSSCHTQNSCPLNTVHLNYHHQSSVNQDEEYDEWDDVAHQQGGVGSGEGPPPASLGTLRHKLFSSAQGLCWRSHRASGRRGRCRAWRCPGSPSHSRRWTPFAPDPRHTSLAQFPKAKV